MRIRRQALAVDLLTEAEELLLRKAAFEEGTSIDARRGVALYVDEITAMLIGGRPPEMHEAGVVEGCSRLEARDVASEFGGFLVGLEHDGESVPADGRPDPVLDGPVTGMGLLPLDRNCVDVGCRRRVRDRSALPPCSVDHLLEEEVSSLRSIDLQNTMQRVEPFSGSRPDQRRDCGPPSPPRRLPSDAGALIT